MESNVEEKFHNMCFVLHHTNQYIYKGIEVFYCYSYILDRLTQCLLYCLDCKLYCVTTQNSRPMPFNAESNTTVDTLQNIGLTALELLLECLLGIQRWGLCWNATVTKILITINVCKVNV